jgi:hypothetical protein
VVDLAFRREGDRLIVTASGSGAAGLNLASRIPGAKASGETLTVPLPAVEVSASVELPSFGSETQQMKVLDERYDDASLQLRLAAPAGSTQSLMLRENHAEPALRTNGAQRQTGSSGASELVIQFPPGTGYVEKTVRIDW